jgi:V/A-type H+-transporting ATPase subunit E
MMDEARQPSGVGSLIERLRDEGVKAGQEKADEIVREAQARAQEMIAKARTEAEEMLQKAGKEIETERAAAHESLRIAIRDTELRMEAELKAAFSAHVRRLVSMELQDRDFMRQVILAVAGIASGDLVCAGQPAELLLPTDLFVTDAKGTGLTDTGKERLRHLVLSISGEMLREGVKLKPDESVSGGIRIRMVDEDIEIDLSDKALSDLLLKYLLPRYRAIVTGAE